MRVLKQIEYGMFKLGINFWSEEQKTWCDFTRNKNPHSLFHEYSREVTFPVDKNQQRVEAMQNCHQLEGELMCLARDIGADIVIWDLLPTIVSGSSDTSGVLFAQVLFLRESNLTKTSERSS